jgi:hypothetical protein
MEALLFNSCHSYFSELAALPATSRYILFIAVYEDFWLYIEEYKTRSLQLCPSVSLMRQAFSRV